MRDRVLQAIGAMVIACALLSLVHMARSAPAVHPLAITSWRALPVSAR